MNANKGIFESFVADMCNRRAVCVEEIEKAKKNKIITNKEADVLYQRFINWRSQRDVAVDYACCREWIASLENRAFKKIDVL